MSTSRMEYIQTTLNDAFNPSELEVIDDSHLHVGHASAGGGGHFTVKITSELFKGKTLIQRHRLVYTALEKGMQSEIHALSIKASAPGESS